MAPPKKPILDSVTEKFQVTDDGCWEWTGAKSRTGYGYVQRGGKLTYAHRTVWETVVGPIPESYEIDHLCRNRGCVNPDHLEPVTSAENAARSGPYRRQEYCRNDHKLEGWNRLPAGGCRLCYNARMRRYRKKVHA